MPYCMTVILQMARMRLWTRSHGRSVLSLNYLTQAVHSQIESPCNSSQYNKDEEWQSNLSYKRLRDGYDDRIEEEGSSRSKVCV